jgi:probable RNA-binding protein EIF1AD
MMEAIAEVPPARAKTLQMPIKVRSRKSHSKYLTSSTIPSSSDTTKPLLVELPARFRSTIWIKRGGFVLVDLDAMKERENKLDGEIVNVVRNEKEWRKQTYWPKEFVQRISYADEDDSDEEESNAGKMPPSDSEDE